MTDLKTEGLGAYTFKRTEGAPGAPLLLTFHGTGGDETQFHGLAQELMPRAHVISPRGDVSEGGHARFFRRTGMGVYDMDDLARATKKMAGFLEDARAETGASRVIAMGYSNGANIIAATALERPELVDEYILMHPLIPWKPAPQPGLAGKRVLVTGGKRDPITPAIQTEALSDYLAAQGAEVMLAWHEGGHEITQNELAAVQSFLAVT
ncbi:MAG: alpha/beta hydrolase [Pseudomonadota bacterium]